jgi:membrane complex biogenesis BtpA family protein
MDAVLNRAVADATALARGGMDGVLVENYGDVPFHAESVSPVTVAAMAVVVARVVGVVSVPVGVNVLRNDARAALGIAAGTGARFIRVNVHTGVMWTDQGIIEGRAAQTLRTRASLGADVAILADVSVKHATPPPGQIEEDAAADAWHRGLADALVVSGVSTGAPTDPRLAERVGRAVPQAPILIGSGVRKQSVAELLDASDGAIVGTALTRDGVAGSGIDEAAVAGLVEAARGG